MIIIPPLSLAASDGHFPGWQDSSSHTLGALEESYESLIMIIILARLESGSIVVSYACSRTLVIIIIAK